MAPIRPRPTETEPFVAVVPMRGGSKGLPGKNLRPLGGVPLYAHSVQTALDAGAARVLVSTDIERVMGSLQQRDVEVYRRPKRLASDTATMAEVLLDLLGRESAAQISEDTIIALLQPTSPLRSPDDVRRAVGLIAANAGRLAMGVTATDSGVLKYGQVVDGRFVPLAHPAHCFANRQSLPPVYRPNGAVYAFRAGWFLRNGGFETAHIAAVEMSADRSIDVDSIEDFERAEALLFKQKEGAA